MMIHLKNIYLENLEKDILLNKKLINVSEFNRYEILFENRNLNTIFDIFLDNLKINTQENFDIYVKNMWGYIRDDDNENLLTIPKKSFKDELLLKSKYSFIYQVKGAKSNFLFEAKKVEINVGDLIIFKTNDFIKDETEEKKRILLIGSISSDILIKNENRNLI